MDYNSFAKTFSNSRKNMKWEEIDFFLEKIPMHPFTKVGIEQICRDVSLKHLENYSGQKIKILDIWCWNWRLIDIIENKNLKVDNYLWVDLSKWLLEEAKILHKSHDFLEIDMLELYKIEEKFDFIFFIASFHHLKKREEREKVLDYTKNLLKENWVIFMTNWALNSEINEKKYRNMIIDWSKNNFWSIDYNIKIWDFTRFYHCFSIEELEYLFKKSGFDIIENRLFDNKKNYISIIRQNKKM